MDNKTSVSQGSESVTNPQPSEHQQPSDNSAITNTNVDVQVNEDVGQKTSSHQDSNIQANPNPSQQDSQVVQETKTQQNQLSDEELAKQLDQQTKEEEKKLLNQEYFDEFNRPKYDDIIQYENQIRQEIENTTPLVSETFPIDHLLKEFKDSIFEAAIGDVMKKYKFTRTVRRDGNCFYRSYLFRLFEHMALKKDSKLYYDILKVTENCKDFFERNFFDWLIVEDFHSAFISEWKLCYTLDPQNLKEYLKHLFQNKERCNYLIYFIRMFTSAYIKENRILYEGFIDEDIDGFCHREIESVDVECDNIQMIAITNAFEYGVVVESIQGKKLETLKFPEDSKNPFFVHMLFRPGHYDILYE